MTLKQKRNDKSEQSGFRPTDVETRAPLNRRSKEEERGGWQTQDVGRCRGVRNCPAVVRPVPSAFAIFWYQQPHFPVTHTSSSPSSFLPVSFPFFCAHTHPLPSTNRHTTTCRCNNLSSPGMNVPGNINHTCTFCYIYYLITLHALVFTFFWQKEKFLWL